MGVFLVKSYFFIIIAAVSRDFSHEIQPQYFLRNPAEILGYLFPSRSQVFEKHKKIEKTIKGDRRFSII